MYTMHLELNYLSNQFQTWAMSNKFSTLFNQSLKKKSFTCKNPLPLTDKTPIYPHQNLPLIMIPEILPAATLSHLLGPSSATRAFILLSSSTSRLSPSSSCGALEKESLGYDTNFTH